MTEDERILRLLEEIRDTQREHLAEYRRAATHSIELQQRAVARQEGIASITRRMILIGGVLVAALLGLLVYLLARYSRVLFG